MQYPEGIIVDERWMIADSHKIFICIRICLCIHVNDTGLGSTTEANRHSTDSQESKLHYLYINSIFDLSCQSNPTTQPK